MLNWNKLTDFLTKLDCSFEKKECLLLVTQKQCKANMDKLVVDNFKVSSNYDALEINYTNEEWDYVQI